MVPRKLATSIAAGAVTIAVAIGGRTQPVPALRHGRADGSDQGRAAAQLTDADSHPSCAWSTTAPTLRRLELGCSSNGRALLVDVLRKRGGRRAVPQMAPAMASAVPSPREGRV
jgi:hypothetical protein